jgi:hypothetical protein
MKVIESSLLKPIPKIQLSHSFNDCSPECKADMNAWLLEMFGTYTPCYIIGKDTLIISTEQMEKLRASNMELNITEQINAYRVNSF